MEIFALNLDEKSFAALAAKVGASPRGVGILARKAGVEFFLIEGLRVAAANIIKQDALSVGADVAVARDVVFGGRAASDAVVFGTRAQLLALAKKCDAQDFGLAKVGAALRGFLGAEADFGGADFGAKNGGEKVPNSNLSDFSAEFCGDFGEILAQNGAKFSADFSQNGAKFPQNPRDFAAFFDTAWARQTRAKPRIMGVVNVTADSFNPASRTDVGGLLALCESLAAQGAEYIDIGAVSSRPGSVYCGADEEVRRVRALVGALRGAAVLGAAKFSLDSYCAQALEIALDAGFAMVNDIAASEAAMRVAGRYGAEYCLMHGWNGVCGGTAGAAGAAGALNSNLAASAGGNFALNSNLGADGGENAQDILRNAPNSNLSANTAQNGWDFGKNRAENPAENFAKNRAEICAQNCGENGENLAEFCAKNAGEFCAENLAPDSNLGANAGENPATSDPYGTKILRDVAEFFARKLALCARHGVKKVVLDVGIGFGKSHPQNLALIKHLRHFSGFGLPLLVGASRKSVVDFYSASAVSERLAGTLFLHQKALENGASFVRAHDVFETRQMVEIMRAYGEI